MSDLKWTVVLNAFLCVFELNYLQQTELRCIKLNSKKKKRNIRNLCTHQMHFRAYNFMSNKNNWISCLRNSWLKWTVRRNRCAEMSLTSYHLCKGREILLFRDWKVGCHVLVYCCKPTSSQCLTHFIGFYYCCSSTRYKQEYPIAL